MHRNPRLTDLVIHAMPRYETRTWGGMDRSDADIWLQQRLAEECTLIGARLVSLLPWATQSRDGAMYIEHGHTTSVLAVLEFPDGPT